ncbi:hypothetical protein BDV95DRAFT_303033 [Massariosphaeria phaeospora]|uniref:F-box domain-containing protein n=1 Tax=Massariosphaeria phaeospora TaxID=100035 RepID=A0A7C8MCM4_9PLEO|nr:hypothetical protein BDV95DRAFT_303033 [Massariosphaeria phaeospora]
MATFHSLPEELIDLIITQYAYPHYDRKTLAALSLVSKDLRRIVEPHLYRIVSVNLSATSGGIILGDPYALFHTLSTRPGLVQHVEHLAIQRRQTEKIPQRVEGFDIKRIASQTLAERAAEAVCDDLSHRISCLLPNIKNLDLSNYQWGGRPQHLKEFLAQLSEQFPVLKSLQLQLYRRHHLLTVRGVFTHPCLERLIVSGGFLARDTHFQNMSEDCNTRVKHLEITQMPVRGRSFHLTRMERLCSALETLVVHPKSHPDSHWEVPVAAVVAFGAVMKLKTFRRLEVRGIEHDTINCIVVRDHLQPLVSGHRPLPFSYLRWSLKNIPGLDGGGINFALVGHLWGLGLQVYGISVGLYRALNAAATGIMEFQSPVQFSVMVDFDLGMEALIRINQASEYAGLNFEYRESLHPSVRVETHSSKVLR